MAKVLCVLYPDPESGYPPKYAREDIPALDHYPDGTTLPTPSAVDFTASPEQPARKAADRTLNLQTCTPGRDVPRESREKQ
jgi:hypothetical protein